MPRWASRGLARVVVLVCLAALELQLAVLFLDAVPRPEEDDSGDHEADEHEPHDCLGCRRVLEVGPEDDEDEGDGAEAPKPGTSSSQSHGYLLFGRCTNGFDPPYNTIVKVVCQ